MTGGRRSLLGMRKASAKVLDLVELGHGDAGMLSVEGWWSAGVDLRLSLVSEGRNGKFGVSTHRRRSGQGVRQGVTKGVVLHLAASVIGFAGSGPNSSCDLRM